MRDTIFLAYKDEQRAVRQGDWKLIRYPKSDYTQLFNLRDDPDERKNLVDGQANAARVRDMMHLLAQQQKVHNDKAPLTVDNPRPSKVDESFFKEGKDKKKKKQDS